MDFEERYGLEDGGIRIISLSDVESLPEISLANSTLILQASRFGDEVIIGNMASTFEIRIHISDIPHFNDVDLTGLSDTYEINRDLLLEIFEHLEITNGKEG